MLGQHVLSAIIFFVCMLLSLVVNRTLTNIRKKEYLNWGLGIDVPVFYSSKFSVHNNCVTLVGYQEVMDKNDIVMYSIIKMKWWGQKTIYSQIRNEGNINGFTHTFSNLPDGHGYRIEIFSYYNFSKGKVRIIKH
ncbi:hypothetical protein [Bacillus sp. V5-8f]|uniref:hypothetical protein n=1 Tax=Bacillus sp. V5-8f TaxID=2053044 RepID=UPI000C792601|nr:hypothetical protein [Bacillus sp. V5-8f]PLT33368.1 hypothetical protein CUU64_13810 [Bacillus sp. V5-8f]